MHILSNVKLYLDDKREKKNKKQTKNYEDGEDFWPRKTILKAD